MLRECLADWIPQGRQVEECLVVVVCCHSSLGGERFYVANTATEQGVAHAHPKAPCGYCAPPAQPVWWGLARTYPCSMWPWDVWPRGSMLMPCLTPGCTVWQLCANQLFICHCSDRLQQYLVFYHWHVVGCSWFCKTLRLGRHKGRIRADLGNLYLIQCTYQYTQIFSGGKSGFYNKEDLSVGFGCFSCQRWRVHREQGRRLQEEKGLLYGSDI